ncbi:hypothetical protein EV06_1496 [Prochlorococcus sp. MIT 0602]|nr:hypothetical protein EV06_1496 [Prochlorococcus sp. MIT 0602]KGG17181.1 hypothetical protein EV07_0616 [Prochlorococcus sp. MIT 0603]
MGRKVERVVAIDFSKIQQLFEFPRQITRSYLTPINAFKQGDLNN